MPAGGVHPAATAACGPALQRARTGQAHSPGAGLRNGRNSGRAGRTGRCGRLRRRVDPRLFAGPRRPARDGRRRPASRPTHLPPCIRRSHGHPGRRLAAGTGVQDPRQPPGRACRRGDSRATDRYAGGCERHFRHGWRPGARSRRGGPLAHAGGDRADPRPEDRRADPRQRDDGGPLRTVAGCRPPAVAHEFRLDRRDRVPDPGRSARRRGRRRADRQGDGQRRGPGHAHLPGHCGARIRACPGARTASARCRFTAFTVGGTARWPPSPTGCSRAGTSPVPSAALR
jgi:hypothetical protein